MRGPPPRLAAGPPAHWPAGGPRLIPAKVRIFKMSPFVNLRFSRIQKRKGREEYKEAIKDILNKLYWEQVCVSERICNFRKRSLDFAYYFNKEGVVCVCVCVCVFSLNWRSRCLKETGRKQL